MKKSAKDQAIDRVGTPPSNYAALCYAFAVNSIRRRKRFTSEDLIKSYNDKGYPAPDEPRVWGFVMRQLKREGLIRHAGFARYKNPSGHGKPVNVWTPKFN